jgi:hypothetical protein
MSHYVHDAVTDVGVRILSFNAQHLRMISSSRKKTGKNGGKRGKREKRKNGARPESGSRTAGAAVSGESRPLISFVW